MQLLWCFIIRYLTFFCFDNHRLQISAKDTNEKGKTDKNVSSFRWSSYFLLSKVLAIFSSLNLNLILFCCSVKFRTFLSFEYTAAMQIFKKKLLEFIKNHFDLFNLIQLLCIPPLKIVWNIESFKKLLFSHCNDGLVCILFQCYFLKKALKMYFYKKYCIKWLMLFLC